MTGVAALGMYDLPEVRSATDAWWTVVAECLRDAGLDGVPARLDRGRPPSDVWRDPALLLTQTCGYPLTHGFAGALTAVAVPSYAAEGCTPGRYRSAFVVRADDPAKDLADLRGRRAAANEPDSQSGCNALRAAVAPLAAGARFFAAVAWTGAHRVSLAAVRDGTADVAAIDAVTFALLARHAPAETEGLRVLAWSAAAPALPYATRRGIAPEQRQRLVSGLLAAAAHPDAAAPCRTLLLTGMAPVDDAAYLPIPAMRHAAERLGYPDLA